MKISLLTKLPLRYKFVAIAFIGMLAIALTMGIANKISIEAAKERFNAEQLSIQKNLWQHIVKTQFEQLEIGASSLRREQIIPRALVTEDYDLLEERAGQIFTRLLGAGMLQHFQITTPTGVVKYRSDENDIDQKSKMHVVQTAISNKNLSKDIEIERNGHLSSIIAFPLFASGDLVGTGVFIQSLQKSLEIFSTENKLDTFIVAAKGNLLHSSNRDLFEQLNLTLPALGESSVNIYNVADKYFSVAAQAIHNDKNQPIAHIITARDITQSYLAERNANWVTYISITLGILIIVAVLSYYILHSLKPLNQLLDTVYKMRDGDTSARMVDDRDDEIGKLGTAFNQMADEMVSNLQHEMISKEDLEGKINLLYGTVQQISRGDLNAEVMAFSGDDSIDELAAGIQIMIDSLNKLVSQVQQSGIQVTSSSTEIAASAKEHEATITEQAATTNEIMATATQISATSRELASTMREVATVADKTTISANDGQEALSSMESTMMQMNNATASITSKLAVLSEKAANINTVVTTITKVADQTNLLSLNAAIEAEKAGEYGLGFAVVATEIRRLADQTAVATWDIEQMVKEMQSAVSAGVMGMDKFSEEVTRGVDEVRQIGGQLAQIIDEVQTLTPRFDAVNEGMQSQSHGAQQISDGMVQLSEATQQTVKSLRQSNVSIETLNHAAHRLQDGVSQFRVKS